MKLPLALQRQFSNTAFPSDLHWNTSVNLCMLTRPTMSDFNSWSTLLLAHSQITRRKSASLQAVKEAQLVLS